MLFHTHLLLGILFFLVFRFFFHGGNLIIFFILVLLGSILPDLDSKYSKIHQWSGFMGLIITFFAKHRGLLHSLLFHLFLFFIVSFFFSPYYASGLLLGSLAHLLADGTTRRGVQVFSPFSLYTIKGPLKAGGFIESVLLLLIVFLILKFIF